VQSDDELLDYAGARRHLLSRQLHLHELEGHAHRLYALLADKKRLTKQHHWIFGVDELRGLLDVANKPAYKRWNNPGFPRWPCRFLERGSTRRNRGAICSTSSSSPRAQSSASSIAAMALPSTAAHIITKNPGCSTRRSGRLGCASERDCRIRPAAQTAAADREGRGPPKGWPTTGIGSCHVP